MEDRWTRRKATLVIAGSMAFISCAGPEGDDSEEPETTRGDDSGTDPTDDSGTTAADCGPPEDDWTALSSGDSQKLASVGAWMHINVGGAQLVVAHVDEDCYVAVDRACTHQGCDIDYDYDYRRFKCPCHAAVYAEDGSKITGPQPRGVASYSCAVGDDGLVYVDV